MFSLSIGCRANKVLVFFSATHVAIEQQRAAKADFTQVNSHASELEHLTAVKLDGKKGFKES